MDIIEYRPNGTRRRYNLLMICGHFWKADALGFFLALVVVVVLLSLLRMSAAAVAATGVAAVVLATC